METIEVLIKISKEDYEYIKEIIQKEKYALSKFYYSIVNGTVLPKGHDDLIERAQVTNYDNLYDVPAVIKADKENNNENNP